MKTYERLYYYKLQHPEEFYDTTESLTNFLLELGYTEDKITQLLSNPITRDCVEVNLRSFRLNDLKNNSRNKILTLIKKL